MSSPPGSANGHKRRRRQDPVSCSFCRQKKLKCDRSHPCSNCRTRSIPCVSAIDAESQESVRASAVPSARSAPISSVNQFYASAPVTASPESNARSADGPQKAVSIKEQSDNEHDDELTKAAIQLETSAVAQGSFKTYLNGVWDYSSAPPNQPQLTLFVPLGLIPEKPPLDVTTITASLPSHSQALRLFDHYVDNVNWMCHMIHVPTTRQQLQTLYHDVAVGRSTDIPKLALLATILGLGAHFWNQKLGMSEEEAAGWAHTLVRLAQHALVQCDYTETPTLNTVQAVFLLVYFLLGNVVGPTTSTPVFALLVYWCQALQIHVLDSRKSLKRRQTEQTDCVDLETKRRVWTYICSTDWLVAAMHGPRSGTYIFNPNQMWVNLPSNVDDDALDHDGAYARPFSVPTEMAYHIYRHQLAEVCRATVDGACTDGVTIEDLDYATVLRLDERYETILSELPYFYRLDDESRLQSKIIDKVRPYIAWQRNWIHLAINSKRSQLHRAYLARGFHDSRYARSREVCLESARFVLIVERSMRADANGLSPKMWRLWTVVHHLFLAALIIGMDYRFNTHDLTRREEVIECCRALEVRQRESPIASKGLEQLKNILREMSNGDQHDANALQFPKSRFGAANAVPSKNLEPKPSTQPTSTEVPQVVFGLADSLFDASGIEQYGDLGLGLGMFDLSADLQSSQWDEVFRDLAFVS